MSAKRPSIVVVRDDRSKAGLMLSRLGFLWRAYTQSRAEMHGADRDWGYVWDYVSDAIHAYDKGNLQSNWWQSAVGINVWHLHATIRQYPSEGGNPYCYWDLGPNERSVVEKAYAEAVASLIGYVSALDYVTGEGC